MVTSEPLDWHGLVFSDYWGTPLSAPESHKSWRPATTLTFWLNRHLAGGLHDPQPFHLVNMAFHAANTLLVGLACLLLAAGPVLVIERESYRSVCLFLLIIFVFGSKALSAMVLFGLHPM